MNARYSLVSAGGAILLLQVVLGPQAAAQSRSMTTLDGNTSKQIVVESLTHGTIAPVPVVQAPSQSQVPGTLAPTHSGPETSLLLPVNFGFNSDQLTPQARSILDVVADAMNDARLIQSRFLLEGHTDASGSWGYNKTLSERRAWAVAAYLSNRGVQPHRLMVVGYSWNRLLPGLSPRDARNRRVELGRLQ